MSVQGEQGGSNLHFPYPLIPVSTPYFASLPSAAVIGGRHATFVTTLLSVVGKECCDSHYWRLRRSLHFYWIYFGDTLTFLSFPASPIYPVLLFFRVPAHYPLLPPYFTTILLLFRWVKSRAHAMCIKGYLLKPQRDFDEFNSYSK